MSHYDLCICIHGWLFILIYVVFFLIIVLLLSFWSRRIKLNIVTLNTKCTRVSSGGRVRPDPLGDLITAPPDPLAMPVGRGGNKGLGRKRRGGRRKGVWKGMKLRTRKSFKSTASWGLWNEIKMHASKITEISRADLHMIEQCCFVFSYLTYTRSTRFIRLSVIAGNITVTNPKLDLGVTSL